MHTKQVAVCLAAVLAIVVVGGVAGRTEAAAITAADLDYGIA